MKSRYVGDIDRNKLRFGYSGMRCRIRVSIQGSGTRISGYPLRSLLKTLLASSPSGSNKPLFQVKFRHALVPLSDTRLRKQFSIILSRINMAQSNITFHSLRRSGATWSLSRIFKAMAPGRRIVSGPISHKTTKLQMQ